MASNPITFAEFPTTPSMPAVARILARYDRNALAAFISVAIDLLDALDGDPDVEDDDPDTEHDGAEEQEEYFRVYGIDQSMPISFENPGFADHYAKIDSQGAAGQPAVLFILRIPAYHQFASPG